MGKRQVGRHLFVGILAFCRCLAKRWNAARTKPPHRAEDFSHPCVGDLKVGERGKMLQRYYVEETQAFLYARDSQMNRQKAER